MADESLKSIRDIMKKYGEGSVYRLGEQRVLFVHVIPTGSLALDIALGVGGLPRGRITEIYGPLQAGKTSLCLHVAASCQSLGGNVAFVDVEHSLDTDWAQRCGVDTDQLYVAQPQTGEQALDIVELLLPDFDLVVLDSVAALVPRAELEGEMGDAHMALQARLMSQAMRKLSGPIKDSEACVIFTNQLRQNIGQMFGPSEVVAGGTALGYYAGVMVDLRRRESIKEGDEVVGNVVKATVKKNKVAPPFRIADFEIYYDEGISRISELVFFGVQLGVIGKAGAGWYTLEVGGGTRKVQGIAALRRVFQEDLVLSTGLENIIRANYGLPLRG